MVKTLEYIVGEEYRLTEESWKDEDLKREWPEEVIRNVLER